MPRPLNLAVNGHKCVMVVQEIVLILLETGYMHGKNGVGAGRRDGVESYV